MYKELSLALEEIIEKINLTPERGRQNKEKAMRSILRIRRLRHASRSKNLRSYLG